MADRQSRIAGPLTTLSRHFSLCATAIWSAMREPSERYGVYGYLAEVAETRHCLSPRLYTDRSGGWCRYWSRCRGVLAQALDSCGCYRFCGNIEISRQTHQIAYKASSGSSGAPGGPRAEHTSVRLVRLLRSWRAGTREDLVHPLCSWLLQPLPQKKDDFLIRGIPCGGLENELHAIVIQSL